MKPIHTNKFHENGQYSNMRADEPRIAHLEICRQTRIHNNFKSFMIYFFIYVC